MPAKIQNIHDTRLPIKKKIKSSVPFGTQISDNKLIKQNKVARPFKAEERKALKKDFLEKYEESNGLTYATCQRIGISAETLSNWRQKDKKFDKAIKEIDERIGDMVIGKLMESIMRGDRSSIYFWLKCRRHWSETHKVEVEQKGEVDINAVIQELKETLKEDE